MSRSASRLDEIIRQPEGAARTAALAVWFQDQFGSVGETPPVLVGGAAVELYTGGAYTTGDLDFVGRMPSTVAERLRSAGFRRDGRHWVHQQGKIFIELPGSSLGEGEKAVRLSHGDLSVLVVDLEALVVDRLAAWTFWNSELDGVAAVYLLQIQAESVDRARLQELAADKDLAIALESAWRLIESEPPPTEQEVMRWASRRG